VFLQAEIGSWDDFVTVAKVLSVGYIFRGQGDAEWPLETSFHRLLASFKDQDSKDPFRLEKKMLHEFQRRAHRYLPALPERADPTDWLAIMQHHGCPTRLLDFTYSFFVATFFALEEIRDVGAVFALPVSAIDPKWPKFSSVSRTAEEDEHIQAIFDEANASIGFNMQENLVAEKLLCVEPRFLSERMSIQQGLFLMPTKITLSFMGNLNRMFQVDDDPQEMDLAKLLNALHSSNDGHILLKFTFPASISDEILCDLERMNVTAATLFPGLDGYMRSLKTFARMFQYDRHQQGKALLTFLEEESERLGKRPGKRDEDG